MRIIRDIRIWRSPATGRCYVFTKRTGARRSRWPVSILSGLPTATTRCVASSRDLVSRSAHTHIDTQYRGAHSFAAHDQFVSSIRDNAGRHIEHGNLALPARAFGVLPDIEGMSHRVKADLQPQIVRPAFAIKTYKRLHFLAFTFSSRFCRALFVNCGNSSATSVARSKWSS